MSNVVSPTVVHYPELNKPLDGRYQVNEILAARLWGRTYLAQDLRRPSQAECIIYHFKPIPEIPHYAELVRSLFGKETALLEAFGTHEQIPQLLACFEDDEGFYVVQEFIEGRSLSHELTPNIPWSDAQVVTLLREVLEPLAFIHDRGGLHGNIKPDNLVRRQNGRLALIDFGSMPQIQRECMMAYAVEGDLTRLSEQAYQPIEQLQGVPCAASDVYAIGMIAAQALTGKHPTQFQIDPQSGDILWLPHYEEAIATLNRGLVEVVNRMVQWDLSQRFVSAGEALQALQAVVCLPHHQAQSPVEKHSPSGKLITVTVPVMVTDDQTGTSGMNSVPVVSTETHQPFFLTRLLMSAIASPSLRIGVGGTALTAIVAAIGWSLLNSVNWSQSNPILGKVNKKLQKAQGLTVQAESITPESMRIVAKAEVDSKNLLQTAYDRAQDHDFTTALKTLKQIVPETTAGAIAQTKVDEYTAKQAIKAQADLQKAYDRAILRDFTQALTYLWQIPKGTPAYAIAQKKVVEYSRKEQIRARLMLKAAADYAQQQNFLAALTSLEKIPSSSVVDEVVEQKLTEYTAKLNQQAAQWLQQANAEAATGRKATAIAYLKKVAIGTPAYAQAREQLAAIVQDSAADQSNSNPVVSTVSVQDLNPSTYLREATPMMALRRYENY